MNVITFRELLLIMIQFRFAAKAVTVETALLYGELEQEIYMECPTCMKDIRKYDCIILVKCIHGLVQAVRHYNKKAVDILKV